MSGRGQTAGTAERASVQRANSLQTLSSGRPPDGVLAHVQVLLEIVVVAIFVACFLVQPFRIPSGSMLPTLQIGDFLLVNKQAFAPSGPLDKLLPPTAVRRGDLVVFHYPVDPSVRVVKRVIGLPGDRLRLQGGHVYIDGQRLAEPYAVYTPSPPDSFRDDFPSLRSADPNVDPLWWAQLQHIVHNGEIDVPAGRYFVMGDNRNDSEDSRYWGFVPRAAMVGRPFLVYFSIGPPATEAPQPQPGTSDNVRAGLRHAWSTFHVLR